MSVDIFLGTMTEVCVFLSETRAVKTNHPNALMSAPLRVAAIDMPKQQWHPFYARAVCSMDKTIEKTPCYDEFKDLMHALIVTSKDNVPVKISKYYNLMQCLRAHGLPV
jgi:hypothetical protein